MQEILNKVRANGKFLKILETTLKETDVVGGGSSAGAATGNTGSTVNTSPENIGSTVASAGKEVKKANTDYNAALRAALLAHPDADTVIKDPTKLQAFIQNILTPQTTI